MYHKYGKNTKYVRNRIFAIVNVMNLDYKMLNISVVLVGLEIWNTKDQIEVSTSSDDTLTTFSTWKKEKLLPRIAHDNAQLITDTNFEGTTIGEAYIGDMCSEQFSAGVDQDHSSSKVSVASTLVHEMGHNLGMDHDQENCSCSAGSCFMSPVLRYDQKC
ncbi:snake venom metalloproteinase atroxlysin-1-like [Rana temporaria]|uniref:snake venom metalloproteinase atroxlysin-1-like n=1 Tax=Rana temporaria TaxID=8407 RepID=UPI001AAD8F63|nr:snake venom metalloproteinase atroxlysin-1-like [Rana temporaria]